MSAIRGIVASAGLEAAEAWSYSNIGDLTVTRPGSFQPLFTIHVDFQDGRFGGGVLYAGERVVNGAPYRSVPGGSSEHVRERSIHARYADPNSMDKALDMLRKEAQRHAPRKAAAPDRLAVSEFVERIKAVAAAESPETVLNRLVAYMAERAVEDGDDAILVEALEHVGGDDAPKPR